MSQFPARELTELAAGFHFLEGPRWRNSRLYFSDFGSRVIYSVQESGADLQRICRVPEQPSGLGFTPDGDLLVVSMLDRKLMREQDGVLIEVGDLSSYTEHPINDMTVDASGRAYIGGFGFSPWISQKLGIAEVYLVEPDGSTRVAATGLTFSNGMVWTLDGKSLLVAETYAARIAAFDVTGDGSLTNHRIWADFSSGEYELRTDAQASGDLLPDGMAIDCEGAVWVADAGGSGAVRVVEGGEILDRVEVPEKGIYAVALGGSEGTKLFMCSSPKGGFHFDRTDEAAMYSCRVDVPAPD